MFNLKPAFPGALEDAVDAKIGEQSKFVAWWKADVSIGHGRPEKGPRPRTFLSAVEAERLTGMTKQRVSDLGRKLKKRETAISARASHSCCSGGESRATCM
jgi:hypothetical protein